MKQKHADNGEGDLIRIKIDPDEYPHIRELLRAKNPLELEEEYGVELDRDLLWPPGDKKTISIRAAAILEAIARRRRKRKENDE